MEGHSGIFAVLARHLRLSAEDILTHIPQDKMAAIFADDSI